MNINELLHLMIEKKASDLHLKEGRPPIMRVDGKLAALDMEILSRTDMREMMYAMMDEKQRRKFELTNEMDLAYNLEGVARFRANAFQQMGKYEVVLRAIPIKIPTMEELMLPSALAEIALLPRGLVLVTGTTGSGKSTTLASMINKVNENYAHHIVTIEDPVEFVHQDKRSSVSQREVGLDTENFTTALKYVLRQDPDVILIGEMRDAETVATAISAAETGHMVFSTLHTMDTIQTINRILDFFPKEQQGQIRMQLAGALRAVVSLRLIAKSDGMGRVPAVEIMVVTPTVRGYLEDGRINMIKDLIKDGAQSGMQTFDQAIVSLYKKGLISMEEAKKNATSQQEIDMAMKGITSSKASAQSILDNMLKEQSKKEYQAEIRTAKDMASSGRVKDAFAAFEKLRNKYPNDTEIAEQLETLRASVNREQFGTNVKAVILDGLGIYKKGNIRGAIVKWQEGLSLDPENVQLKSYIKSAEERLQVSAKIPGMLAEGVEIYKTGHVEEAIRKWREIMLLDPANAQAESYIKSAELKLRELQVKKEVETFLVKGNEESARGNLMEAIILYKRALDIKPDSKDIRAALDKTYAGLMKEDFGSDVEAAIIAEAFQKGIEKLMQEDYMGVIREWKKTIEKRPLEKKLKNYVEKAKQLLKQRMEELMEQVDGYYREKRIVEAMATLDKILKIDPANEFALKYKRDIKPLMDEEVSRAYTEAMQFYTDSRLQEAKERLMHVLRLDPGHLTARKRLEEVNERLAALG
ncbi:MAG: PilT/PilU family type 4a pilus ATPase [Spirochaetia bacterium]|nr:PilT/PilU family type 4a pilus ATPase [Spirochaetia bacterium]